jgi:hypothetical protein
MGDGPKRRTLLVGPVFVVHGVNPKHLADLRRMAAFAHVKLTEKDDFRKPCPAQLKENAWDRPTMARGRFLPGFDAVPAFSARSPALDGVSWVQSGLVESAVGRG